MPFAVALAISSGPLPRHVFIITLHTFVFPPFNRLVPILFSFELGAVYSSFPRFDPQIEFSRRFFAPSAENSCLRLKAALPPPALSDPSMA